MPRPESSPRASAPYALRGLAASLITGAALLAAAVFTDAPRADTGANARPVGAETLAALVPLAAEIGDSDKLEVYAAPAPAPEIVFSDGAGRPVALSDFRGKIVLLNFWATFCAPCIEEMPALNALQARLGGPEFEVVAVNLDFARSERARAWLETHEIDHLAFYRDASRQSAADLGAQGLPLTLLVDRTGAEVGRLLGAAAWDDGPAIELIELMIADGADDAAAPS